jgi:hypothetical protein
MRSCGPAAKILGLACAALALALSPGAASAAEITYFFHGGPNDDLNRAATFGNEQPPPAGSMTFDTNPPDGTLGTQTGGNPNPDFAPNPLAIWWSGPFTGPINGNIKFDWWWQTSNATGILLGVDVNIKIIADPDFTNPGVGTQTIIGELLTTTFSFPDVQPQRFLTEVPVSGTVASRLLIQVAARFVDTGPSLKALYDSATAPANYPSQFNVPTTPTAATLLSFAAKAARAGVTLSWRTGSESDIAGFNVWRWNSGAKQKVNRSLLPARGAVFGSSYSLVDRSARSGKTYVYRLQLVHRDGSRSWYTGAEARVTS